MAPPVSTGHGISSAPRNLQGGGEGFGLMAVEMQIAELAAAIDNGWMLLAGALVFFMHCGFTMLESGCVKSQNRQSIMLKNILVVCASAFAWFMFGYGLAFGEDSADAEEGGGVTGTSLFFAGEKSIAADGAHAVWFFQYTFCATAATIVSGALAERVKVVGFILFAFYLTAITYPIQVHWGWSGGWLAKVGSQEDTTGAGYMDFAGSGLVHMFGGVNALVGAAVLGARTGRFENPEQFRTANPLLTMLGTFFLWFGWYGFNGGSTFGLSGGNWITAARCCITTTCAASAGGIVALILGYIKTKSYDLPLVCNGILAGLVGITAGCSNVEPIMAFLMGGIGAVFMYAATLGLEAAKIDDPVGAFPVHGAAGAWGVLAAGLFDLDRGVFYLEDGANGLFGPNLIGLIAIAIWALVTSVPAFVALKVAGLLRLPVEIEMSGIDAHEFVPQLELKKAKADKEFMEKASEASRDPEFDRGV